MSLTPLDLDELERRLFNRDPRDVEAHDYRALFRLARLGQEAERNKRQTIHGREDQNHEAIWLAPKCEEERAWCVDNVFEECSDCGNAPVRYVRADLAERDALAARLLVMEEALRTIGEAATKAHEEDNDILIEAICNATRKALSSSSPLVEAMREVVEAAEFQKMVRPSYTIGRLSNALAGLDALRSGKEPTL